MARSDAELRQDFSTILRRAVLYGIDGHAVELRHLAETTGIPLTTVRDWFYRGRSPKIDSPRRLAVAKYLGVTLAQINGIDPIPKKRWRTGGDDAHRPENE